MMLSYTQGIYSLEVSTRTLWDKSIAVFVYKKLYNSPQSAVQMHAMLAQAPPETFNVSDLQDRYSTYFVQGKKNRNNEVTLKNML